MNNFPPNQRPRRPQQQGPQQFAPVNVIMALIQQSRNRYKAISEMIQMEDQGFRQLDLEASQMAQLMMGPNGEADPRLHALTASLQAAKRAGAMVRQHLEDQLQVEKFLNAELMRWTRGQAPIQMAEPTQGNAPSAMMTPPPAGGPSPQLAQGQVPQAPPSYFQQTPAGLDPLAQQQQPQQQRAPQMQQQQQPGMGVPNHMFGPYPGMPQVPFQPAPPESLPVTQLPVQQVPFDPSQLAIMPPPVQAQHYASPEAARAAIPGPPPPVVHAPPVVQYASPEAAKSAVEASHANNVPAVSVPQANGQQIQKPVS